MYTSIYIYIYIYMSVYMGYGQRTELAAHGSATYGLTGGIGLVSLFAARTAMPFLRRPSKNC